MLLQPVTAEKLALRRTTSQALASCSIAATCARPAAAQPECHGQLYKQLPGQQGVINATLGSWLFGNATPIFQTDSLQDPAPSRGSQAWALKDASSNGELYQVMYSYASLGFLKHLKAKLKKKKIEINLAILVDYTNNNRICVMPIASPSALRQLAQLPHRGWWNEAADFRPLERGQKAQKVIQGHRTNAAAGTGAGCAVTLFLQQQWHRYMPYATTLLPLPSHISKTSSYPLTSLYFRYWWICENAQLHYFFSQVKALHFTSGKNYSRSGRFDPSDALKATFLQWLHEICPTP